MWFSRQENISIIYDFYEAKSSFHELHNKSFYMRVY